MYMSEIVCVHFMFDYAISPSITNVFSMCCVVQQVVVSCRIIRSTLYVNNSCPYSTFCGKGKEAKSVYIFVLDIAYQQWAPPLAVVTRSRIFGSPVEAMTKICHFALLLAFCCICERDKMHSVSCGARSKEFLDVSLEFSCDTYFNVCSHFKEFLKCVCCLSDEM